MGKSQNVKTSKRQNNNRKRKEDRVGAGRGRGAIWDLIVPDGGLGCRGGGFLGVPGGGGMIGGGRAYAVRSWWTG